jgi:hypothetical protein
MPPRQRANEHSRHVRRDQQRLTARLRREQRRNAASEQRAALAILRRMKPLAQWEAEEPRTEAERAFAHRLVAHLERIASVTQPPCSR